MQHIRIAFRDGQIGRFSSITRLRGGPLGDLVVAVDGDEGEVDPEFTLRQLAGDERWWLGVSNGMPALVATGDIATVEVVG